LLSIIIVNYNSAQLIIDCLQSVYQYNSELDLEVLIVDNNSNDGGETLIKTKFPHVHWLNMKYNAGFARANNKGLRSAQGELVLLLNPDTIAIDDSITQCYQILKASEYVAAGVQLKNEDGSNQISGSFFVKGGLNHLLPIPYWGDFIRWVGYRMHSKIPHIKQAKDLEEVDWINGAFLMVKKHAIEKAGLLDEDFFLYSEEIEWCSRLKKVGKLCIMGALSIIHLQGETVSKAQDGTGKGYENLFDRKGLQLMVSHHVRIRKQYGVSWFLFLLLNYTWGILVFVIFSSLHHLIHLQRPWTDWKKVVLFAKNVFTIWKLTPVILQNKPHFYKMF
jgi:GT2 family glycosyltransferase